ncbi:hypothetical protein uan_116 [Pseudomonas phage UAntarctica]|nr:hypothetical protein uan_116 [Pseudomonas phage UAntarctica]
MSGHNPKRILNDGSAVRSNLIPRDTFPGDQLTKQERKAYQDLGDELDGSAFFRYKGRVYGLHQFNRTNLDGPLSRGGWTGVASQSAHHAIVISIECIHEVVVGEIFP